MHKNYKIVRCAGGIVKNLKDQVVLVLMDDVVIWDFPKGGIDEGEQEINAAIREITEETGIRDLKLVKKLKKYSRFAANGNPVLMDIAMFLFETSQDKLFPSEDEIREALWVDRGLVVDKLTLDVSKEYFKSIIKLI